MAASGSSEDRRETMLTSALRSRFGGSVTVKYNSIRRLLLGAQFCDLSRRVGISFNSTRKPLDMIGKEFFCCTKTGKMGVRPRPTNVKIRVSKIEKFFNVISSCLDDSVVKMVNKLMQLSDSQMEDHIASTMSGVYTDSIPPVMERKREVTGSGLTGVKIGDIDFQRRRRDCSAELDDEAEEIGAETSPKGSPVKMAKVLQDGDEERSDDDKAREALMNSMFMKGDGTLSTIMTMLCKSMVVNQSTQVKTFEDLDRDPNDERMNVIVGPLLRRELKSQNVEVLVNLQDDSSEGAILELIQPTLSEADNYNCEEEGEHQLFNVGLSEPDIALLWVISGMWRSGIPAPDIMTIYQSDMDKILYNSTAPPRMSLELFLDVLRLVGASEPLVCSLSGYLFAKSFMMNIITAASCYTSLSVETQLSFPETVNFFNPNTIPRHVIKQLNRLGERKDRDMFEVMMTCSSMEEVMIMMDYFRTARTSSTEEEITDILLRMLRDAENEISMVGRTTLLSKVMKLDDDLARREEPISLVRLNKDVGGFKSALFTIFSERDMNLLSIFAIESGYLPKKTLTGIIKSTYLCSLSKTYDNRVCGRRRALLQIVKNHSEKLLSLIGTISSQVETLADKIAKRIGEFGNLSGITEEMKLVEYSRTLKLKMNGFTRVKGKLNEMILSYCIGVPTRPVRTLQCIMELNCNLMTSAYLPLIIRNDLSRVPDNYALVRIDLIKDLFKTVDLQSNRRGTFDQKDLERYSSTIDEKIVNVVDIPMRRREVLQMREAVIRSEGSHIDDLCLVIFEFGHSSQNKDLKKKHDAAKYRTIQIISREIFPLVMITMVTARRDYEFMKLAAGVGEADDLSIQNHVTTMQFCDAALALGGSDYSNSRSAFREDQDVIRGQYGRGSITMITNEECKATLDGVACESSNGILTSLFPAASIFSVQMQKGGEGGSLTAEEQMMNHTTSDYWLTLIHKNFCQGSDPMSLPQFAPLKTTSGVQRDTLVQLFHSGIKEECKNMIIVDDDVTALEALYLKSSWRVDRTEQNYNEKVADRRYKLNIKLNDTLSSSVSCRVRSALNQCTGRAGFKELIKGDVAGVAGKFMVGRESLSDGNYIGDFDVNSTLKSLILGVNYYKTAPVSGLSLADKKASRPSKHVTQMVNDENRRRTVTYQLVSTFMTEDGGIVRYGSGHQIIKYGVRDPLILEDTMIHCGVGKPSEEEMERYTSRAKLTIIGKDPTLSRGAIDLLSKMIGIKQFYYDKCKLRVEGHEEVIGRVEAVTLGNISPIMIREDLSVSQDSKFDESADHKVTLSLVYIILFEMEERGEIGTLLAEREFSEKFMTNNTPQAISGEKVKNLVKRQHRYRSPIVIKEFVLTAGMHSPMLSPIQEFDTVIESFWGTLKTQMVELAPELLKGEMHETFDVLAAFLKRTNIIDDLIILSFCCSKILSLIEQKRLTRMTHYSYRLFGDLWMDIGVPAKDDTAFRCYIRSVASGSTVSSETFVIDEINVLPNFTAPYFYLFYFVKSLSVTHQGMFPKVNSLTQQVINNAVVRQIPRVADLVSICGGFFAEPVETAYKVRRFMIVNTRLSPIHQITFSALYLKMVSIPAIICNDKGHNTTMQNIRYAYMSVISDSCDLKGIGAKLGGSSRRLECMQHIRCVQAMCGSAIASGSTSMNVLDKKKLFTDNVFIDTMNATFCKTEIDFVSSFYQMHGYFRGLLSSQSSANVHNAFFKIPIQTSIVLADSISSVRECPTNCVNLDDHSRVTRSSLCHDCKVSCDRYVRVSQVRLYEFSDKEELSEFITSSFKAAQRESITITQGCPYFQLMVGYIALRTYTSSDMLTVSNDSSYRAIARTEYLKPSSVLCRYDKTFDPMKAQRQVASKIHGGIFKGAEGKGVTLDENMVSDVEEKLAYLGVNTRDMLLTLKKSVMPSVTRRTSNQQSDNGFSHRSFAEMVMDDSVCSSILNIIGTWIIWSKDGVLEDGCSGALEECSNIMLSLTSVRCKQIVTGVEDKSSSSSECMRAYKELSKSVMRNSPHFSASKIRALTKRAKRKDEEKESNLSKESKFKDELQRIGCKMIKGHCGNEMNEMSFDERLVCIKEILTMLTDSCSNISEAINMTTSSQDREALKLHNKKAIHCFKSANIVGDCSCEVKGEVIDQAPSINPDFIRLCDKVSRNIETIKCYNRELDNGFKKDMMNEMLSSLDQLGREMVLLHQDDIVESVSLGMSEMSTFPLSCLFPCESKFILNSVEHMRYVAKLYKFVNTNTFIVSGMFVMYGANLGTALMKAMNLRLSEVGVNPDIILLTAPLYHDGVRFNPCLGACEMALSGSRKSVELMRNVVTGTATKRSLGRLYVQQSNRVVFEIAQSIAQTQTSMLWDAVVNYTTNPTPFVQKIAAKAQFGSDRDLVVQDAATKECMAMLERMSKGFLKQGMSDMLVHPERKLELVKQMAELIDAKMSGDEIELAIFSSDERKWAPTHSAMGFLNTLTPLFRQNHNMFNLLGYCCVKNVGKYVLVDPRLIESVISYLVCKGVVIVNQGGTQHGLANSDGSSMSDLEMKALMEGLSSDSMSVLKECVLQGKTYMRSQSHMGQGIFHATSSLTADCLVRFQAEFRKHCKREGLLLAAESIPDSLNYETVRSSDDSITIVKDHSGFSKCFRQVVEKLYLFDTLTNSLINIRKSSKHVGSYNAMIGEVYSTFTTDLALIPVIKEELAILTSPPSSTLLSTAIMRFNMSKSCIEGGSSLALVVFINAIAYTRDVLNHPKTSSTVMCSNSYPMCYTGKPTLSFSDLLSDPFSHELVMIIRAIKKMIGLYTYCLEKSKVDDSNEIYHRLIKGDYSAIDDVEELSGNVTSAVDVEMQDVLYASLQPGEVHSASETQKRAVRAKDNGIYSDIQKVPISRAAIDKLKELKSEIYGDLTRENDIKFTLLELCSSQRKAASYDTTITKAAQSVRSQDPNSQRSLNPVNAFTQSRHGVVGFYCTPIAVIDSPRVDIIGGDQMTSFARFSRWKVNHEKVFSKKEMKNFCKRLSHYEELQKYVTEVDVSISKAECGAIVDDGPKTPERRSFRTVKRQVKVQVLPVTYLEFCGEVVDSQLMTENGLGVSRSDMSTTVSTLGGMTYNLIVMPCIVKGIYEGMLYRTQGENTVELGTEALASFKYMMNKYTMEYEPDQLRNSINYCLSLLEETDHSGKAMFDFCMSLIKHWSDLISSSKKKSNAMYMLIGVDTQDSEELDLVKRNSSTIHRYRVTNGVKERSNRIIRANEQAQKEGIARCMITLAGTASKDCISEVASMTINEVKRSVDSAPTKDLVSRDLAEFVSDSYDSYSTFGTSSINVSAVKNEGMNGLLYRNPVTKQAALLMYEGRFNKNSFLVTEDPNNIEAALYGMREMATVAKLKPSFDDIIHHLPKYEFPKSNVTTRVPVRIEGKTIATTRMRITKPVSSIYAMVGRIGEKEDANPTHYTIRNYRYEFKGNYMTVETTSELASAGRPVTPWISVGGDIEDTQRVSKIKKLYGSRTYDRSQVKAAYRKLPDLEFSRKPMYTTSFIRKLTRKAGSLEDTMAIIVSGITIPNGINSEDDMHILNEGRQVMAKTSNFANVLGCLFDPEKQLINRHDVGTMAFCMKYNVSWVKDFINEWFGGLTGMYLRVGAIRDTVLNAKGLKVASPSRQRAVNVLVMEDDVGLLLNRSDVESFVRGYKFNEKDSWYKRAGKKIILGTSKGSMPLKNCLACFKRIIDQSVNYCNFKVMSTKSKEPVLVSKEWGNDLTALLLALIGKLARDRRFDLLKETIKLFNTICSVALLDESNDELQEGIPDLTCDATFQGLFNEQLVEPGDEQDTDVEEASEEGSDVSMKEDSGEVTALLRSIQMEEASGTQQNWSGIKDKDDWSDESEVC